MKDRTRSTYRRSCVDRAHVLAEVDGAKAEIAMLIACSKEPNEVTKLERQFDWLEALSRDYNEAVVE